MHSNSDLYSHVRVVISIMVGLSMTTLLSGLARFVQHPKREHVSLLHVGWAFSLLLWVIHWWWWEFRLTMVEQWTFDIYFFIIVYAIFFFVLAKLMFPDDVEDYRGYEDYFISRRKWFFGILALFFIADIIDTRLKGVAYMRSFGLEYPIREGTNLLFCVVGFFSANRRVQFFVLAASFLFHILFILRYYRVE